MAEIISLNQVRKQKNKAEKQAKSAENRSLFGQSKPEKSRNKAAKDLQDGKLDGLRIFRPPEDGDDIA